MDWKYYNYKEENELHQKDKFDLRENIWFYYDDDGVARVRIDFDRGCWNIHIRNKYSEPDVGWYWEEIEECFINITDAKRFVQKVVEEMEKDND